MKRIFLLTILACASMQAQWLTGYFSSQNTSMPVSSIPWSKYTHIIHFAAAPNSQGNGHLSMYYLDPNEIRQLIASRPGGKQVLMCIKDNDNNASAFSENLTPANIGSFVNDIKNTVNTYGYDGVDIDWEHNVDLAEYHQFLVMLRSALPNTTITITTGDWDNLPAAAADNYQLVDQINVMCYDMDLQGGGDCGGTDCSWYNSAITQNGEVWKRTADERVAKITRQGVPNDKIGIGLPFYARIHSGVTLPMVLGDFAMSTIHFRDLTANPVLWNSAFMRYDSSHQAQYLSVPALGEFVSYNGIQSMNDYVDWVKSQGFGGVMAFSTEMEFQQWASGDAQHPLSSALHNSLFGSTVTPDPAPVLSNGAPSGSLSYSTTSATLSVATNENATCAYSTTPGTAYSAMSNQFSVNGGTQHSTNIGGLQSGGSYHYYVRCADGQGAANTTDYKIAFTVADPPGAPFSPTTGSGSSATFTWNITDNNGAQAIQQANLLIAGASGPSCYLQYWAPNTTLYLQNDAGNGWTQGTVGSSGTLQNSQCSVNLASASASASGNVLTLSIPIAFSVSNFSGQKNIYTFAAEASNIIQGWSQSGTWSITK